MGGFSVSCLQAMYVLCFPLRSLSISRRTSKRIEFYKSNKILPKSIFCTFVSVDTSHPKALLPSVPVKDTHQAAVSQRVIIRDPLGPVGTGLCASVLSQVPHTRRRYEKQWECGNLFLDRDITSQRQDSPLTEPPLRLRPHQAEPSPPGPGGSMAHNAPVCRFLPE